MVEKKLQALLIQKQNDYYVTEAQLGYNKNLAQTSKAAGNELAPIPNDTITYRSVGRMFLLDDMKTMKEENKATQERCKAFNEQFEPKLEKLKKELEKLQEDLKTN